jgi:hypothetical protein
MRVRLFLFAGLVAWFIGVSAGMARMWSYGSAPGRPAEAPRAWPAVTRFDPHPGRPALVVLLHPQCPCSRATIAELARLLAQTDRPVETYALMLAPQGQPAEWVQSDLWRAASAIPGVKVVADPDGTEARRFGAVTSGEVLLYGTDRRLQFAGGITGARGHEGDNAGRAAVVSWLAGQPAPASAPVYGCALFDGDQLFASSRRQP